MKEKWICLIFLFPSLFALYAGEGLPSEALGLNFTARQLNYVEEGADITLLPAFSGYKDYVKGLNTFAPSSVVELLYTMPLPETGGKEIRLYLLQALARISSLEGLEYWSGSRGRMYTYLEEAYPVSAKRSRKQLDDPSFSRLPDKEQNLYVFQKDTTFGKAWYEVHYTVLEDGILLSMVNTSVIRYKMFPVMREGRLRIDLLALPGKDELVFYGSAAFKLGYTFGIKMDLSGSFDHRMSALQSWFARQIY